jgi:phage shock protein PspC (stress-responsive transcriptional regulator)
MTENTGTIPTPPPAPYPTPSRPPLRRSRTDRVLGGVAAGFARWLGIDPVVVRVIVVVLAIFGGSGLLLYVIGWLFIPVEGEDRSEADKFLERSRQPGSTSRTILIVVAVVLGLILLGGIAATPWGGMWGGGGWLLLLVSGGLVLWLMNRPGASAAAPTPPPATEPVEGPAPSAPVDQTGYAYGGAGGYPGYVASMPTPVPAPAPRPRSYLGLATLSLAVVTVGVLASLAITGLATIPPVVVLAAGLGVLGAGLLVGAFAGRARWLIALAVPLLLVTAVTAAIPTSVGARMGNGIGERVWTPTTTAQAAGPFTLGIGSGELDLTAVSLPDDPDAVVPVTASIGVGELKVVAPPGARVVVEAHVGLGEIDIEGMRPISGQNRTITTELPGPVDPTQPTIAVTADVAIGNLEVSRA